MILWSLRGASLSGFCLHKVRGSSTLSGYTSVGGFIQDSSDMVTGSFSVLGGLRSINEA